MFGYISLVWLAMAAMFCNLNSGSGLKKLEEYFQNQNITGSYMVNSPSFHHNVQRHIYGIKKRPLEVKNRPLHSQAFLPNRAHDIDTSLEEESQEEISKATLLWRAIKLPIYSVALVPLTVGSAAAFLQTGLFMANRYFVLLASSILIIAWLNLSNDVYDFDTGADKNKKESVVNMVGRYHCCCLLITCSRLLGSYSGIY